MNLEITPHQIEDIRHVLNQCEIQRERVERIRTELELISANLYGTIGIARSVLEVLTRQARHDSDAVQAGERKA